MVGKYVHGCANSYIVSHPSLSSQVLSVQDAQSFLEGLDLLLAPLLALLVAHACFQARRLQLLVILVCRAQLLLCGEQIGLLLLEGSFQGAFSGCFPFDICLLFCLVNQRGRVLCGVFLLCLCFISLSFRRKTQEIGFNDLQHRDDAIRALSLVWRIKDGRGCRLRIFLQKRFGSDCPVVELLQDCDGPCHCGLSFLCICDRLFIFGLFFLTKRVVLVNVCVQSRQI
mmetsp:Transcript_45690/g.85641  ORF Transcript_45690/g.85641 Transcript_45690/m.85641 type:complete len:227 (+) Transcript_45690:20-700(+)